MDYTIDIFLTSTNTNKNKNTSLDFAKDNKSEFCIFLLDSARQQQDDEKLMKPQRKKEKENTKTRENQQNQSDTRTVCNPTKERKEGNVQRL